MMNRLVSLLMLGWLMSEVTLSLLLGWTGGRLRPPGWLGSCWSWLMGRLALLLMLGWWLGELIMASLLGWTGG